MQSKLAERLWSRAWDAYKAGNSVAAAAYWEAWRMAMEEEQ